MPKKSIISQDWPPEVTSALAKLGENLALARVRRKESQRVWAARIGISVPTLIRLERGDANVGMGIYATALWMMGRAHALGELANPIDDMGAFEQELSTVKQAISNKRKTGVRSNASTANGLSKIT